MIRYRLYTAKDQEAIEQLNSLASKDGHFYFADIQKPVRDIKHEYFDSGGAFWVAQESKSKQLVGMVGVKILDDGGTGKVKAVRVHPDFRRLGIASHLMKTVEDFLMQNKIGNVILNVSTESDPACRLYGKIGYQNVGKTEFLPGKYSYRFIKTLKPK